MVAETTRKMSANNLLLEDSAGEGEQDPVFISIADLFSLLSLAVIYVMLVSSVSPTLQQSMPVFQAVRQESGQGTPIDPHDLYFSIARSGSQVLYFATRNGQTTSEVAQHNSSEITLPAAWVKSTIANDPSIHRIYVVITAGERDLVIRSSLIDMLLFLNAQGYSNVQIAAL